MERPITHLMAVREAALLFAELANGIIEPSEGPMRVQIGQTHAQFRFGPAERGHKLKALSDRVLRPNVELMVAIISRNHKRICACQRILKVPDEWSGDVIVPPNKISMRLATLNQGDPDREVTRLDAMYGIVDRQSNAALPWDLRASRRTVLI